MAENPNFLRLRASRLHVSKKKKKKEKKEEMCTYVLLLTEDRVVDDGSHLFEEELVQIFEGRLAGHLRRKEHFN